MIILSGVNRDDRAQSGDGIIDRKQHGKSRKELEILKFKEKVM